MSHRHPHPQRARGSDEGSALTELAIVSPLFILLIFWSQFFVDLGQLKLKAEEASRYAVWEMAAQRPIATVQTEVRDRFKDLSSPTSRTSATPVGVRAFKEILITQVNINDQIDAKFGGRIPPPSGGNGGLLSAIMNGLTKLANRAVDAILGVMKFNTKGEAESIVSFRVQNSLFPVGNGGMWSLFFDSSANMVVNISARSPPLLVNTWKAWPGKFAESSQNVNTDPYDTYPSVKSKDGAPEREVAKRMEKVAFFGLGGALNSVSRVLSYVGVPFTSTETWKTRQGPITMLPGQRPTASWQPGFSTPNQRVGDEWHTGNSGMKKITYSPEANVDRSRSTVPSTISTDLWGGKGGYSHSAQSFNTPGNNPYLKMYQCRSVFYMGSKAGQIQRWGESNYASRAFSGCP